MLYFHKELLSLCKLQTWILMPVASEFTVPLDWTRLLTPSSKMNQHMHICATVWYFLFLPTMCCSVHCIWFKIVIIHRWADESVVFSNFAFVKGDGRDMIYDHYCFKYRARDCFGCLIMSSGTPKVSRITLLSSANRDLGPPRSTHTYTHTYTSQLQIFP